MKHLLITISILLFISGCETTDDADNSEVFNTLLGSWGHAIPPSYCVEIYVFESNGNWSAASLDEISAGNFTLNENASTERHSLTMSITYDNGLSDCLGVSSIDTGSSGTIYIEFPDPNTMEWYLYSTDSTPSATLTKGSSNP